MDLKNKRIIISKVNQIGDVVCALPLASAIKQLEPSAHIIFLGREYTRDLIEHYQDVDEFADWEAIYKNDDEASAIKQLQELKADIIVHVMANHASKIVCRLAKKAKIPIRIGTSHRFYTLLTCNRFVNIGRSHSDLHETQFDMMFMKALGGKKYYSLEEIIALRKFKPLPKTSPALALLDPKRFNIILHPKSRVQNREWKPEQFAELIRLLPQDKFRIIVSGSEEEVDQVRDIMLTPFPHVAALYEKIKSLNELMQVIQNANGLICASTGPVHLAAAFGIRTLGLYAPMRPFHAGRWGPVGSKASVLCVNKTCNDCKTQPLCHCIWEITPQQVLNVLLKWYDLDFK